MEGVIEVPKVKLNSGHEMPVLAMGTAFPSLPDQDELVSSLIHAIEIGYRHFDTAAAYGSEEALGRAVAAAIQRGLVSGRDQLFITSKLWITETDHDLVLPALKRSLGRLGLDYVDLYLIHWPLRMKDAKESLVVTTENIIPFDMKGTWEGMEECHKLGLAKSIGVSNFTSAKISKLLQSATIPPAVNQVEMSVAWQQGGLLKFCGEKGIHVSAWSPLGNLGAGFWGCHGILEIPLLKDIAQAKHKTIAQGRIECNRALTFQASLNGEDNGGSFRVNCSPRSSVSPSRTADRRRPIASSDVVPLLRRASRPGNPSLSPSPLFSGEEQSRRRWWKWMMSANITSNDYFAPSN